MLNGAASDDAGSSEIGSTEFGESNELSELMGFGMCIIMPFEYVLLCYIVLSIAAGSIRERLFKIGIHQPNRAKAKN